MSRGSGAVLLMLVVLLVTSGCYLCPFLGTNITTQQGYSWETLESIPKNREIFLGAYTFGEHVRLTDQFLLVGGQVDFQENKKKGPRATIRWEVSGGDRVLGDVYDLKVRKSDGLIPETKVDYPIDEIFAGETISMYYSFNKRIPPGVKFRLFSSTMVGDPRDAS